MGNTEVMFPGGIERAVGIAEISEWFDWMRREIPGGGIALPHEVTATCFAGHALRFRDRIRDIYHHLPIALEKRLIESAIVYQCWELEKETYAHAKWPEARRAASLITIEAERYIRPMGNKWGRHLVEGADGFLYAVIVPTGYDSETGPATEVICNRLSRLLGLSVPKDVVVVVSADMLRAAGDTRHGWGSSPGGGTAPNLCAGFRYADLPPSDILPLKDQRLGARNLRQLVGSMILDIWMLNFAERKWSSAFSEITGRNEVTLEGAAGCLCGGDWLSFLGAFGDSKPAGQAIASQVKTWNRMLPWLRRIRNLDMNPIWDLVFQMPPEWYGGRRKRVIDVLEKLESRRSALKSTVCALVRTGYFPAIKGNSGVWLP